MPNVWGQEARYGRAVCHLLSRWHGRWYRGTVEGINCPREDAVTKPRWRLGVPAEHADPHLDVEVRDGDEWLPGTLTMRRRDATGAWWAYVGWEDTAGVEKTGWLPHNRRHVRLPSPGR